MQHVFFSRQHANLHLAMSVGPSVPWLFLIASGVRITAPAHPSTTGLPCIRPCFISIYSWKKKNRSKTWKNDFHCTFRVHCSAISEENWTKFMSFWKLILCSFDWDWPKIFSPRRVKDMNLKKCKDQTSENIIFTLLRDTTVAPFLNENAQNSWSSERYLIVFF